MFKYPDTADAWYSGVAKRFEKPPPDVIIALVTVSLTASHEPAMHCAFEQWFFCEPHAWS